MPNDVPSNDQTSLDQTSLDHTSPDEVFDAVVLGVGSGGEVVAGRLADAGWRVAAVEADRVGGICPYVACVPSKAMLLAAARHRNGLLSGRRSGTDADPDPAHPDPADHASAWRAAVRARDAAAEQRDDSGAATALADRGVRVVRGRGRVTERDPSGPGGVVTVDAGGAAPRRLSWRRALVIGVGAQVVRPPVDGLDHVPTWWPEQALSTDERPARLVVLGGGAVGCELSQVYAAFGVAVTLVETERRLLSTEPDWVGEHLAGVLRGNGVDVRVAVAAERAEPVDAGVRVHLSDASAVEADRVLVATGRRPRSAGLGLEVLGVHVEDGEPLAVDARCRVRRAPDGQPLDDVFAVGDVTGLAPFTHTATYQGRIVAAHLLGRGHDADYSGVPRVLYTHPAVYGVGRTTAAGAGAGATEVRTAGLALEQTGRAFVEQQAGTVDGELGRVELVVESGSGRVVGAAAVGPAADSWGGQLGLAVRAGIHIGVLADQVQGFPTWQEVLQPPAEELSDSLGS